MTMTQQVTPAELREFMETLRNVKDTATRIKDGCSDFLVVSPFLGGCLFSELDTLVYVAGSVKGTLELLTEKDKK